MFQFPFYDIACYTIPKPPSMKVPERFISPYGSRMTDVFMRYDKLLYSSKHTGKSSILNGSIFPKIDSKFTQCKKQEEYRKLYNVITKSRVPEVKLELIATDDKVHVMFRYQPSDKKIEGDFGFNLENKTKYKKYEDYYVLHNGKRLSDLSFDEILNDYVSSESRNSTNDHISDITWYIFKYGNYLTNYCMNVISEVYKKLDRFDFDKKYPDKIWNLIEPKKINKIKRSGCYITYFNDRDCDISKWCAESLFLGNSKNFNERSKLSEMTSMYILNKYFGAKTARSECDVKYWNDFWKKCDYITNISNKFMAISVSRMNGPVYFYMPTRLRLCIGAMELLYKKIYGLVVARSGIVEKISFNHSLLHVFVDSVESAYCISFVFNELCESIKSDITLIITVINVSNKLFIAKFFH
jgi:hypothetical protein